MASGLLSAELTATCNALGYYDGSKYYTDTYCKETIKDLIRYLRRDDEEHQIRRHLGNAKIVQTDLIPIVIHHSDDEELFDVALRLMVNLTTPTLILYRDEIPAEKTARNYYLQIISHLQAYKEAFADEKFWDVIAKRLSKLLQMDYIERDEDVSKMMERILILTRNVLHVPADPSLEKRPDNDASVHDQILWALHLSGIVDIFLYIASTDNEQQFYLHILEIVSLMLREQSPKGLASAAVERSIEEKERDDAELLAIRQSESIEKRKKIQKYAGSRHSRFGGTYIIKNMKSISENDIIFHKSLDKALHLTFDAEKTKQKTPKNRMALQYTSGERRSAFSIRLFLKEFCIEFLNGAYNPLMRKVKENLIRNVAQPNDESYYFWAMKFFMEFNREYKFQVKLVSETMSKQTFHFVQTQLETWHEMMTTDKKKIPIWSRRMHLGVKAYQELLLTLMVMSKSTDYGVKESARIIMSNIFYVVEYRELIVTLLIYYNEIKFSIEYLKDVVETAHIFVKMLEHFSSKNRNMYVQKKAKSRAKQKNKKAAKKSAPMPTVDLEALWDEIGPQVSAVLQSQMEIPNDIVPFDAASDLNMDQQKVEAMKKIQVLLKQDQIAEAVGLLRAAREVWPENDCFGSSNIAPEEEFLAMKEVFVADLGQPSNGSEQQPDENEEEDSDSEDDEEDEQEASLVIHEQSFNFSDFVKRFASARIVQAICHLMANFERNSAFTNHCIVKLLHRIAWDCKVPAVLFQASVFRTFQRIFASTNSAHKELAKFAVYIIRCFSEIAKTNRKIFMELLFWKDSKDAYEIEYGYGSLKSQTHSTKNVWTEEQEDELRRLYAEWERDKPEPDPVDFIMKNLIRQDRSRRSIIKKLKEMYLLVGNQIKSSKVRLPKEFSEEEIRELTQLYSEFNEAVDPVACIMGRISVRRPKKQIINKLVELGLVHDRKQLYKKRGGKSKETEESQSESEDDVPWYNRHHTPAVQQTAPHPKSMEVSNALHCVIDSDLKVALEWLLSCIKDAIEDISDDSEDVAILPLSDTSILAMDNTVFLNLLEKLGIKKPTDQEVYWRIPGEWKIDDFNLRITVIEDALEGRFVSDETAVEYDNNRIQTDSGRSTPVQQPKKVRRKPKKKQKPATTELFKFNPAVAARALRSVIDIDKREAVDWLLISLKDGLEDVETSREDVALVPLSEAAASALDDPLFINLLDKLSLKKPSQQETFWRIPGDWNSGDYKSRIKVIEDGLEGDFSVADIALQNTTSLSARKQEKNTTKKQKATRPKKMDNSDWTEPFSDLGSHSENEDSEKENSFSNQQVESMNSTSSQTKRKQRHIILDSSSDEDNASSHTMTHKTVQSKFKSTLINSDSEYEDRLNNSTTSRGNNNNKNSVKKRRIIHVDSSSDEESIQKTQVRDAKSHSESEDQIVVQSSSLSGITIVNEEESSKRKRTLIDSSSDEETQAQKANSDKNEDSSLLQSSSYTEHITANNKDSTKRKRLVIESSSDEEILTVLDTQKSETESRSGSNLQNKIKVNEREKVIVDLSSDEEMSQDDSAPRTKTKNMNMMIDLDSDGENGTIPVEKSSVHNTDDRNETDSISFQKKRVQRIDSSSDDE